MLVADTTPTFPTCATYGFTADPHILVKIVQREGGFERVNRKWSQALRRYTGVPIGNKPQDDIEDILYFWLAIGGCAGAFRFKDWTDYKSCRLSSSVAATDQPFTEVEGSPGGYQLVKQYVFGALTHVRPIRRPIGSTVLIANELGQVQDDSTWDLDESTGILQTLGGFSGVPNSWGGEFDVYCRFDAPFIPEVSDKEIQNATVSIVEKREV